MQAAGGEANGSGLEHRARLVIVNSPDVAAPLVDALAVADVGAWMWVEAERALYVSPRVLELLGLSREPEANLLSRFFQSVHPDDQEPVRTLLLGARPGGPFTLRYRFTPPDGPLRWIEDRGRVERDRNGTLIRQGGAMREVTHEVGRELEQQESEARLEALVNAMPFAVWGRTGPDLIVSHQNAASIATWGDLRGHALASAPSAVRELWEGQLAEVMTGQIVRARREHLVGGTLRAFDEIIAPVIVDDEVTGAVGVAIDATEQARASKYQALLTSIASDFASRPNDTLDEGVVSALEKVARFLGVPVAMLCEFGGTHHPDQLRVTHWWIDPATGRESPRLLEIDAAPVSSLLRRAVATSPVVVRSRDELPEGSRERAWLAEQRVQSFALVSTPHLDGPQTLLALAGVDDTPVDWPGDIVPSLPLAAALLGCVLARIRADADQKAAERRLQEAQKLESLGVLAGGIAHDFNNLLTAILGNASLLRGEVAAIKSAIESVEQIENASRRAAELCRQMLAYAGRGRFALQHLDVNALLRDMQAPLEVTLPRTARLEFALAPSLPAVLADESQIRQLVMNLVLNAAEALAESTGNIVIRTSAVSLSARQLARTVFSPQLPGGQYVSLSVIDTGHGMSAETIERIFDPFFSTRFTGRGLGLAAVLGVVRAHKGALRVHSGVGEGATFELLLPARETAAAAPAETLSPTTHRGSADWRTVGTALVIDDERGVRNLVRTVLERAGMTVVVAESGEQGVEMYRRMADDVRIVLVDLTMPGMDGRETLAAIRRERVDVPAIMMSGYSLADLAKATSHVFLQKPFTPATLRAAVKQALDE